MRALRKAFFTGLALCLPLAITVYVVQLLLELVAKPAKGIVLAVCASFFEQEAELTGDYWVEKAVLLVSALIVVLGVTLVGWFSRYLIGRLIIDSFEQVIERVPMVKSVYTGIKQLVATFSAKNKANFKEVVLVQFPHQGAWTVAFVTNRDPSELSETLGYPLVHVFVPTTPNPTGGYFLLLPESAVKPLAMSVADGMKLIVSGGSVLPESSKRDCQPKPAGDA